MSFTCCFHQKILMILLSLMIQNRDSMLVIPEILVLEALVVVRGKQTPVCWSWGNSCPQCFRKGRWGKQVQEASGQMTVQSLWTQRKRATQKRSPLHLWERHPQSPEAVSLELQTNLWGRMGTELWSRGSIQETGREHKLGAWNCFRSKMFGLHRLQKKKKTD